MLIRRWLINTNTGKASAYAVDAKTKALVPCHNFDYFDLLKHKDVIKTGFLTEKEAQNYYEVTRKNHRQKQN